LVVNDGSTDRGPKIARDIRDPRIRIIDQGNAGVSAARNHGIAEAKADLIAFLDADDEWMPDFLETILRLRERFSSCKVFATRYFFCSSNGQQRPATVRGLPAGFSDGLMHNYFDIASISDPPLFASAIAVKKEALMEIESFPVGISSGEDLLTWARLATRYDIAYNNEPKAFFWGPIRVSDRPGRVPNEPDFVGDELARLMESADPAKSAGLRRYLSLWHRMRAVIFIQLGDRRNALEEIRVAMSFASSIRLFLLLLIAMLPGFLPAKVLLSIKRIKASY
jgi:glycosyltransferase involved in cell wall biosynthesis